MIRSLLNSRVGHIVMMYMLYAFIRYIAGFEIAVIMALATVIGELNYLAYNTKNASGGPHFFS